MHGFALTDHDTISGHVEIDEAMQQTGMLILPSIEVTSAEGHILALGVRQKIPKGLGVPDTVAAIHAAGGLACAAHPLRIMTGLGPRGLDEHARQHLDAIEGHNARERPLVQKNTHRLAASYGLPLMGGSDAHWVQDIGTAYTLFDRAPSDTHVLLSMIRDGLCRPAGGALPRHKVWGHGLSLALPAKWRGQ